MTLYRILTPLHHTFAPHRIALQCPKSLGSYRFYDLGKIHSVPTTLGIFARSGMRHINKVGSISHAERKRGRMESAREARSRRRKQMPAFPLCSSFTRMLVRRPADKKIFGIAVLFQPDVNARTKSAKRGGITTSNNPREVIYPREIWPRRGKETEKERKRERENMPWRYIHTAGHSRRKRKQTSLYE